MKYTRNGVNLETIFRYYALFTTVGPRAYTIGGLHAFTAYAITYSAINAAGEGERSAAVVATTKPTCKYERMKTLNPLKARDLHSLAHCKYWPAVCEEAGLDKKKLFIFVLMQKLGKIKFPSSRM